MLVKTMPYRRYKQSYADCETIPGTYNPAMKTIDVEIPDGRMKPSGTRGQRYLHLTFTGIEIATGRKVSCTVKATCEENARKRLPTDCIWD